MPSGHAEFPQLCPAIYLVTVSMNLELERPLIRVRGHRVEKQGSSDVTEIAFVHKESESSALHEYRLRLRRVSGVGTEQENKDGETCASSAVIGRQTRQRPSSNKCQ